LVKCYGPFLSMSQAMLQNQIVYAHSTGYLNS
jgi:hypothetical protein